MNFRRNWLHYDEHGFLRAGMLALFPDCHALYSIVEIDRTFAGLRAMFPKSTVKGVSVATISAVLPVLRADESR